MRFTSEQLQTIISEKPIGNSYPYNTKDDKEIEKYILNLFYSLNCSPLIKCSSEFNHYGSGYASYVDFFCYKKEDCSILQKDYSQKSNVSTIEIEGFVIYVSRLAPVAVIGIDTRYHTVEKLENRKNGFLGAFTFLQAKDVISTPPNTLAEEFREVVTKLQDSEYTILDRDYVSQSLPFKAQIPTILSVERDYRIFDAIFYWMD